MLELSLHILDLAQNAISAGAQVVTIVVSIEGDRLTVMIVDDGCGMSPELLGRVTSPFATTRTTRKVGLGIPMFKQLAEMCEGTFAIESTPGLGTRLTATFRLSHVDLPPMGDLAGTVRSLIVGAPEKPEFVLELSRDGAQFVFDTREVRKALGGLPLNEPEILTWIGDYLREGVLETLHI